METTADETTVPRELAPIEALVNTVEIDSGEEQLSSPAALRDWLAGQGLLDATAAVGEACTRWTPAPPALPGGLVPSQ